MIQSFHRNCHFTAGAMIKLFRNHRKIITFSYQSWVNHYLNLCRAIMIFGYFVLFCVLQYVNTSVITFFLVFLFQKAKIMQSWNQFPKSAPHYEHSVVDHIANSVWHTFFIGSEKQYFFVSSYIFRAERKKENPRGLWYRNQNQ